MTLDTLISGLFEAGIDAATIQKLAWHADRTMTAAYTRQPPDSERLAIGKLAIPAL
jgi:hypothetical protein